MKQLLVHRASCREHTCCGKAPQIAAICLDFSRFHAGIEYIFGAVAELNVDEGYLVTGNDLRVSFEELLVGPLAVSRYF
jgi:hypothetical protein